MWEGNVNNFRASSRAVLLEKGKARSLLCTETVDFIRIPYQSIVSLCSETSLDWNGLNFSSCTNCMSLFPFAPQVKYSLNCCWFNHFPWFETGKTYQTQQAARFVLSMSLVDPFVWILPPGCFGLQQACLLFRNFFAFLLFLKCVELLEKVGAVGLLMEIKFTGDEMDYGRHELKMCTSDEWSKGINRAERQFRSGQKVSY